MIHPFPKKPCACGPSCGPACKSLEDNSLMLLFPRRRKCLMIWFPHTQVGVWLEQSLFGTLAQHQSQMKCLGRSIPKTAGGGSVIPKWISSLLLDVSNCECHISNYVALECVFKLFCYSKETFQHFQPAFFFVWVFLVWFLFILFLQSTYKVSTLS